jgi:hypothetical protein
MDISLFIVKPAGTRVLSLQNTICIDEHHELLPYISTSQYVSSLCTLNETEITQLNELLSTHIQYMEVKKAYMDSADTFWNSELGIKLHTLLHPDPQYYDRKELNECAQRFESHITSLCLTVVDKKRSIKGYNYIIINFRVIMYESQNLPAVWNGFKVVSYTERIFQDIPRLWTNKETYENKKEVFVSYGYGHELPPYRRV